MIGNVGQKPASSFRFIVLPRSSSSLLHEREESLFETKCIAIWEILVKGISSECSRVAIAAKT